MSKVVSICILLLAFTAVAGAVEPGWVVINEIMFNPTGDEPATEWMELFNITTQAISLNGWTIADALPDSPGHKHTFPDLSISGRSYFLLEYNEVATSQTANDIYGDAGDAGNLQLNNDGDTITLKDNSGTTIDTVTYNPSWGGNGNGKSLERKNPWGTSNDSNNWTSSTPDGGTPKAQNSVYSPTAVTLSSLTATFDASKGVLISWTVESSFNNVGWNIYRSETREGEYVKLNDTLIPNAEDATSRHIYEYIDRTASPGKMYYYYIEDVELTGKKTKSPIVVVNGGQSVRARKNTATTWAKIKRGS